MRQTIEEATQDLSAAPVGVLAALITPRVETVNSDAILAAENADLKQQVRQSTEPHRRLADILRLREC